MRKQRRPLLPCLLLSPRCSVFNTLLGHVSPPLSLLHSSFRLGTRCCAAMWKIQMSSDKCRHTKHIYINWSCGSKAMEVINIGAASVGILHLQRTTHLKFNMAPADSVAQIFATACRSRRGSLLSSIVSVSFQLESMHHSNFSSIRYCVSPERAALQQKCVHTDT